MAYARLYKVELIFQAVSLFRTLNVRANAAVLQRCASALTCLALQDVASTACVRCLLRHYDTAWSPCTQRPLFVRSALMIASFIIIAAQASIAWLITHTLRLSPSSPLLWPVFCGRYTQVEYICAGKVGSAITLFNTTTLYAMSTALERQLVARLRQSIRCLYVSRLARPASHINKARVQALHLSPANLH